MQDAFKHLVVIAQAAHPYLPDTLPNGTVIAPGQALTLRQVMRVLLAAKQPGYYHVSNRKAILRAISVVQRHVAITYDCALDVADRQYPLGYDITYVQEFAWLQLIVAAY